MHLCSNNKTRQLHFLHHANLRCNGFTRLNEENNARLAHTCRHIKKARNGLIRTAEAQYLSIIFWKNEY
jgi:hypothetical protein